MFIITRSNSEIWCQTVITTKADTWYQRHVLACATQTCFAEESVTASITGTTEPSEPPYSILSFSLPSSPLFLLSFSFLPSQLMMDFRSSIASCTTINHDFRIYNCGLFSSARYFPIRFQPNTLICNLFSILCLDLCGGGSVWWHCN